MIISFIEPVNPAENDARKTPPIQNLFTVKVPDLEYETTPVVPPLTLVKIADPVSVQYNILNVPSNPVPASTVLLLQPPQYHYG